MTVFTDGHYTCHNQILFALWALHMLRHVWITLRSSLFLCLSIIRYPLFQRLKFPALGAEIPFGKPCVSNVSGQCKIVNTECSCKSVIINPGCSAPVLRRSRNQCLIRKVYHCADAVLQHRLSCTNRVCDFIQFYFSFNLFSHYHHPRCQHSALRSRYL